MVKPKTPKAPKSICKSAKITKVSAASKDIKKEPKVGDMSNNQIIIEGLEKLKKINELEKIKGKVMAYKKAIATIKEVKTPITSIDQVKGLPGIGDGIRKKIQEVLDNGAFREVKSAAFSDKKVEQLTELSNIWGVGPVSAENIWDKGYKSVADLRALPQDKLEQILTQMQIIGLKHYEDLLEKIPRDEATIIADTVKAAVKACFPKRNLEVMACGSYRRGKAKCGDVDVLITSNDTPGAGQTEVTIMQDVLDAVTKQLYKVGMMTDSLGSSKIAKSGCHMFMGVCQVQDPKKKYPFRRIDIKVYPRSQFGFATLYFTGSATLNKRMRQDALKYGYSLSDKGFEKSGKGAQKGADLDAKIVKSMACLVQAQKTKVIKEEDVFKAFGMKYLTPEEREI